MKRIILFLFFFVAGCCLGRSQNYNLNLETVSDPQKLPDGWMKWGHASYSIKVDSVTKHSGKYALLIEAPDSVTTNNFGCPAYMIPAKYMGKQITVKAFMKVSGNDRPVGLMLNLTDHEGHTLSINDTQRKGIMGTTGWKEYSVTLPLLEEAKTIYVGAMLFGPGKLWADDFQILIDGEKLSSAKLKEENRYKASTDTEFHRGSKINIASYTPQMLSNLDILCRVWGFLKYHHPAVAAGEYNWDAELFRIMPAILNVTDKDDISRVLLQWVDRLGQVSVKKEKDNVPEHPVKLYPDLKWINTETLGTALTEKLLEIRDSERSNENYYISFGLAGNPNFTNETSYLNMDFNDDGLRLLALFRYWNIIQYFFPYRYLTDKDWNVVLPEFIPKFLDAASEKDYKLTALLLIAQVCDTHANLTNRTLTAMTGLNKAPYDLSFVEGKAVVTDCLNNDTVLRKGDIIENIDGRPVERIIAEKLPYTPASNYPTQLRNMARELLQTNSEYLMLDVVRKEKTVKCRVNSIPIDDGIFRKPLQKEAYRLLSPDIGYFYPGTIKGESLPKMIKMFRNTKGIIIDFRCYPANSFFLFINYLTPKPREFVKYTRGSIISPGLFVFNDNETKGGSKKYYKGKVVIIVNETTQSSAEYHTMALQKAPRAVVIGSTTAAADGNVSNQIILPGGLVSLISGIGIYYPDGRETQRVGIAIDEEVKPTIQGIIEGRDELLERAIKIIENE